MKKITVCMSLFLLGALILAACAPAATPAAAPAEAKPAEKLKVALVMSGVITDGSWNAAAYSGLQEAIKKYPNIETAYSESVKVADFEATYRDYANKGFNLIIGHGSEFADVAKLVGKDFPKVFFAVTNADVSGANITGLDTKNEECGYVAGYIAGLLTKSKKVAYVGGQEILAMKRAELGWRKGVPASCPDCEVLVAYVGNSNDAVKGKETGLAMIDKGADVLYHSANAAGLGVIEAAKEKKVDMIGNTGDQRSLAPDQIVTSTVRNLAPLVTQIIGELVAGTLKGGVRTYGFDNGIYFLADFNSTLMTADQIAKVKAEVQRLIDGKVTLEHISTVSK